MKVAMVTAPMMGHAVSLIRIAEKLCGNGHEVIFVSLDVGEELLLGKLPDAVKFVGLQSPYADLKEIFAEATRLNKLFFLPVADVMLAPLREVLKKFDPQVVVTDFMTIAGAEAAADLSIPCLVSVPCPLNILAGCNGCYTNPSWSTSFCGVHVGLVDIVGVGLASFLNLQSLGTFCRRCRAVMGKCLFLVQTHYGLEPPRYVPAATKIIGSVAEPPSQALDKLARKMPELCAWLAKPDAAPVVYVSLGTLVELFDWQVEVLWRGFKRAGVRVVWSLMPAQQAALPVKEDEDFWVASWFMQAELLHHDAIKAVVTHCGWGGMLDITSAGKPALGLPFFGDQLDNIDLLVKKGIGELLGQKPPLETIPVNKYQPGMITEESIAAAVTKVVVDGSYAENARRAARAASTTGGVAEAVFHIEAAGRCGVDHQISEIGWRRMTGTSPFSLIALGLLAVLAAIASAAYAWSHGLGVPRPFRSDCRL